MGKVGFGGQGRVVGENGDNCSWTIKKNSYFENVVHIDEYNKSNWYVTTNKKIKGFYLPLQSRESQRKNAHFLFV